MTAEPASAVTAASWQHQAAAGSSVGSEVNANTPAADRPLVAAVAESSTSQTPQWKLLQ